MLTLYMYEALDIETIWDRGVAKPICIAITDKNKINFKKVDVKDIDNGYILDYLLEKCLSRKIYYVHNLTFEMFVFLNDLKNKKIKFKIISTNYTVYSADIWYKNKRIRLRCSYKLTMLSLKKLAELAGMEQKSIFPYKILNTDLKENITVNEDMFENEIEYDLFIEKYGKNINVYDILENYCKNDANITKKSIIKYWKIIEESGLKYNNRILTAAKLSIENYFKNNFVIKKKINLKYDRLIRKGYFGGRVEVFGNVKENEIILHYDWSGMYAQCMSENVMGGVIIESNNIVDVTHYGFYWVKFEQNLEYPILPVKKEKLLFANGIFEGWYWFEEILLAMECGVRVISVSKVITSQYFGTFIKDFVEINNKIREISPLHKQIGKNNNNTFYGRLGMNPERFEEEIISEADNKKYEKIVEKNGIYLGYTRKEKTISNVLIAASITSKARIKLYKGMKAVMNAGGRVLYTDTDSIMAAFPKNIYKEKMNVHIGEVFFDEKKKDTIILDAVFAMPKTYALRYENGEELVKIKGFNVKPDFETFKEAFYNKDTITTENIQWNKKDFLIRMEKKEKKTNLYSLTKRKWNQDLKKTIPLNLDVDPIYNKW